MTRYKPRLGLSIVVEVLAAVHGNVHLGLRLTRVNHLAQKLNQLILLLQSLNDCHCLVLCRNRLLARAWVRLLPRLFGSLWFRHLWRVVCLLVMASVVH